MSDNSILPSWLSRGIEEYFPIKGTDQTFSEIIDHAKKNNKKLRVKLGIDPTGTDIHLGPVSYTHLTLPTSSRV